jgi:hypothetical protein
MTASSLGSVQSNTLSNMNLLLLWPQEPSSIQSVDIRNTIAGHMNRDELVQIDVQNGVKIYICVVLKLDTIPATGQISIPGFALRHRLVFENILARTKRKPNLDVSMPRRLIQYVPRK